jgi:hypothetical protein
VQTEGGPIEEVRPGDVVWFPPGEKHWHGATPTTAMTHIAVQESLNGKNVDWRGEGQRRTIPQVRPPSRHHIGSWSGLDGISLQLTGRQADIMGK